MDMSVKIRQCLLLLLVVGCCQLGAMDFSTELLIDKQLLMSVGHFRAQQMMLNCDKKMVNVLGINAKDANKYQIIKDCNKQRLETVNSRIITSVPFYTKRIEVILNKQEKLKAALIVIERERDRRLQHDKKRKLEETEVYSQKNVPEKRRRILTDRYVQFVLSPFLK